MGKKSSDTPDTPRHRTGNTNKPSCLKKSRSWCFTLNNFSDEDIVFYRDTKHRKYAFQHEVGKSGTHHLQGVVYFANARDFNQMKQLHSKCHWEITKCMKGSIGYCCDINKRAVVNNVWVKGWTLPKQLKLISELRPWQQKVIDILSDDPDDRTVHWFWERNRNVGKTALTKYILNKFPHTHYFPEAKQMILPSN